MIWTNFGATLFGGSGFIRWSLSPFILLFAVFMPLLIEDWNPVRIALIGVMEFMCLALLAGFWLPAKYGRWAFRGLTGAVFLCYASYLVHEFVFTEKPFRFFERRSAASPRNALLGFIIIGLPSLWYAVTGRFTLRPVPPEEDEQSYAPELTVVISLSNQDFGTEEERKRILNLKHRLEEKLGETAMGEIDGEEFGGGECCLFIRTNSPIETETLVREFFDQHARSLRYSVEGGPAE